MSKRKCRSGKSAQPLRIRPEARLSVIAGRINAALEAPEKTNAAGRGGKELKCLRSAAQ